jgi:hypothetical protein
METQDLNTQFLIRVYEDADGLEDRPVETANFALYQGLTFKAVADIVDALVAEGLLVVHTPTHVRLTYKGALEAERLLFPEAEVSDEVARSPEPAAAPALQPGKPRVVFLSHQSDHQELADAIKQQLETAFGNQVRVLLSSDVYTVPGGEQWKERIGKVIRSLSVHLLLCDERTLDIPWLNMEAGFSWFQGKPIIPICFGQLDKGKLPKPFDDSLALDLEDDFADELLTSLEGHLGSNYKAKRQPDLFMDAIKVALKKT